VSQNKAVHTSCLLTEMHPVNFSD